MRVLVTGGGGFIGSHLVEAQLGLGREVRALDLHAERLVHLEGNARLEIVEGSVTEGPALDRAVKGVDLVFHLASAHLEVNLPEETYWKVNVHALRGFMERCRAAGVQRFVQVSSVGVYGQMGGVRVNEDSPCAPDILYEKTKYAGEQEVKKYHQKTGFPIVIARPAWVYGPGCARTERLFRSIKKGRFLMVGNGQTLRYAVYVDDMAAGLELCAAREGVEGETFLLAGDNPVTLNELTGAIAGVLQVRRPALRVPYWSMYLALTGMESAFKVLGRQPPASRRSLRFFSNDMALDTSKARDVLGFVPATDLSDGMARTHAWLAQQQRV